MPPKTASSAATTAIGRYGCSASGTVGSRITPRITPTITVNYDEVAAPYVVTAIGDPDTLASRFVETQGGQWWLDLQALYGVTFEIDTVTAGDRITVPAAQGLQLRYAHSPAADTDRRDER